MLLRRYKFGDQKQQHFENLSLLKEDFQCSIKLQIAFWEVRVRDQGSITKCSRLSPTIIKRAASAVKMLQHDLKSASSTPLILHFLAYEEKRLIAPIFISCVQNSANFLFRGEQELHSFSLGGVSCEKQGCVICLCTSLTTPKPQNFPIKMVWVEPQTFSGNSIYSRYYRK